MRTIVFIDGQNLYHLARGAWASGPSSHYYWPSYDVEKLACALVSRDGLNKSVDWSSTHRKLSRADGLFRVSLEHPGALLWRLVSIRACPIRRLALHSVSGTGFWSNKIRYLRSRGVYVYRGRVNVGGQEKGVDVSLALDMVRATYDQLYDVSIIVSQDWDFGPAVRLAKEIARRQNRLLVFESAFPVGPGSPVAQGSSRNNLG